MSGRSRSDNAASTSAAGQPSVRCTSAFTCAGARSSPASRRSAADSSRRSARSGPRSSSTLRCARRRPRGRSGSARAAMATCAPGAEGGDRRACVAERSRGAIFVRVVNDHDRGLVERIDLVAQAGGGRPHEGPLVGRIPLLQKRGLAVSGRRDEQHQGNGARGLELGNQAIRSHRHHVRLCSVGDRSARVRAGGLARPAPRPAGEETTPARGISAARRPSPVSDEADEQTGRSSSGPWRSELRRGCRPPAR